MFCERETDGCNPMLTCSVCRILTSFLRIMVVLGKALKDHQTSISDVVLKFQLATRTLQHICAHGKVEKEQKMVDLVPKVKKNLELLLFKVKGMLEENGMGQAFWLGTRKNSQTHTTPSWTCAHFLQSDQALHYLSVKHRTIQGKQIQSQEEQEEEEEDGEVDDDDDNASISGEEREQMDDNEDVTDDEEAME